MRINDTETAEVARQNHADDEAMAQKIDSNLPRPTLGPKKPLLCSGLESSRGHWPFFLPLFTNDVEGEFSEVAPSSRLCYRECKRSGGERLGKGWEKAHATSGSCGGGYGSSPAAGKRGSLSGQRDRHRWS
jgi:hypothetical protein